MKSLLLFTTLILPSLYASETSIKQEQYLAPSDIGAYKYTLTAKPTKNQVAAFSITRMNGRVKGELEFVDTHHVVMHDQNNECSQSICVINPDYFRPDKDGKQNWNIAGLGGNRWEPDRFKFVESDGEVVTFRFEGKEDVTVYKITVKVLSLKEANDQYDGLPVSTDNRWEWHGEPKIIKKVEQGGADQPTTAPELKSEGKDKPQPESKVAPR